MGVVASGDGILMCYCCTIEDSRYDELWLNPYSDLMSGNIDLISMMSG